MRKILFNMSVLAFLLAFTACSKDDDGEKLSIDERPVWTEVTQNIYPQGMFITMDGDGLPLVDGKLISLNSQDLLGAFVNGECRGLAVPYDEIDGKTHFYLKVKSTDNDQKATGLKVELRYYSQSQRHIFVSEPFNFELDGIVGSLEEGFKPMWK